MKKFALLVCALALLLVGCGKKDQQQTAMPTEPQTQPTAAIADFTAYQEDSSAVQLSDYFGKPIVLNFWASWCNPCTSEMPAFQAAFEAHGDSVQFLMVNAGESIEEGAAFIHSAGYTFPVLYDTTGEATYAYQIGAIPTTFFLDAEGKVIDMHVGTMSESDLLAAIEAIS